MADVTTSMGTIHEFKGNQSDWSIFKVRLEQYFIANNIKDAKVQRALLLNACDEEAYRLIYSLCVPNAPEEKTYQEILTICNKHFKSTSRPFMARYKFYSAVKHPDESVKDWAARLRNLASKCQFGNELEIVLRDKFIMGFDGRIMDRLFEENADITLEKAMDIAGCYQEKNEFHVKQEIFYQAREIPGSRQSQQQQKEQPSTSSATTHQFRHLAGGGAQLSTGSRNGRAPSLPIWQQQQRPADLSNANVTCGICGKRNHTKDKCFYKGYNCKVCGIKGHLAKMCRNSKYKFKNNYLVDDEEIEHIFSLTSRDTPIKIAVFIGKVPFSFELDTGASISVISEIFKIKYFNKFKILPTNKRLMSYDGTQITPIGYITVNVTYNDKTSALKLYIIQGGGPPLLGRDFFHVFNLSLNSIVEMPHKDYNIKMDLASKFPNVFSDVLVDNDLSCNVDMNLDVGVDEYNENTSDVNELCIDSDNEITVRRTQRKIKPVNYKI
ncbi:hypothetical protein NQ314_017696 [Rhamnusium bicolor]|uniref:Peptidase A2 domain-containing protein n=1 Tax=Rhamnusium bicolor TaxID=1586634 RepID=A0AAV8WS74_9CUCU|nr:hypothetical protein NQ314_017696 [Rhamnusium bicolor]